MKKLIYCLFCITIITCLVVKPLQTLANEESDSFYLVTDEFTQSNFLIDLMECLEVPEPIKVINSENSNVTYEYNDDILRIVKASDDGLIYYTYCGNNLISETRDNCKIEYLYKLDYNHNEICYGFIYEDELYYYVFDDIKSVQYITDSYNNYICKYVYQNTDATVYNYDNGKFILNEDEDFIGNINPIRYQGWYYDKENKHYYIGSGMYYNILTNEFVNNTFKLNTDRLYKTYSSMQTLRVIPFIEYVSTYYSYLLSIPTYGATSYSNVTQTQWNSGKRWYDGLDNTELIARCLNAENPYSGKRDDRTAEAVVIINRVTTGMDTNPYSAVTRLSQFSSINPGTYSLSTSETAVARAIKSKSNKEWQEATLLACVLYYSTNKSDLDLICSIPLYISNQRYFLGVNYAYEAKVFSISNNKWYYNGKEIKDVAIAGLATLSPNGDPLNILYPYYKAGYNVFFDYK